jgi:ribonuclease P protein component
LQEVHCEKQSVKRRYRVREDRRFREIRQRGRSFSNDVIVLTALANDLPYSRFGFAVSSRIGNAVVRNRIKRRLREIIRLRMAWIRPGCDIILIARKPIRSAEYGQLETACARLLRRAQLLIDEDQSGPYASPEVTLRSDSAPGNAPTGNSGEHA